MSYIPNDEEATLLLDSVEIETDASRKTEMIGLLGRYRESKKAAGLEPFQPDPAIGRKRRGSVNLLFSGGLDGVESAMDPAEREAFSQSLASSLNPEEDKAMAASQSWLIVHRPELTPMIDADWDTVKTQFASELTGTSKTKVTNRELFDGIKVHIEKEQAETEMLAGVLGKVQSEAGKGNGDWFAAWKKAAANMSADKAWNPARHDQYRAAAKKVFEQATKDTAGIRPVIDLGKAYYAMAAKGDVGNMDEITAARATFISALGAINPDEQEMVLHFAAAGSADRAPKTLDTAGSGGAAEKIAVSLDRAIGKFPTSVGRLVKATAGAGAELVATVGVAHGTATTNDLYAIQKNQREIELERKVDAALADSVDPIKSKNRFVQGIYDSIESVPYMASAVSIYGMPLALAAMAEDNRTQFIDAGVPAQEAAILAIAAAAPQVAIENIQAGMVFRGRLPGFSRLLSKPVTSKLGLATRMLGVGSIEAVQQNAEEAIQDITTPLYQELGAVLSDSVPDVDWEKELGAYGRARVDTFFALLPLVLLGTAAASFKEASYGREYLSNKKLLEAAGFTKEVAAEIATVAHDGSPEQAARMVQGAWDDPAARTVTATGVDELNVEMKTATEKLADQSKAKATKQADGTWAVSDATGVVVDTAMTAAEAVALVDEVIKSSELQAALPVEKTAEQVAEDEFKAAVQAVTGEKIAAPTLQEPGVEAGSAPNPRSGAEAPVPASLSVAPAVYKGFQEGIGKIKGFDLYNLTADIPGHNAGSTVAAETLVKAGFALPEKNNKRSPISSRAAQIGVEEILHNRELPESMVQVILRGNNTRESLRAYIQNKPDGRALVENMGEDELSAWLDKTAATLERMKGRMTQLTTSTPAAPVETVSKPAKKSKEQKLNDSGIGLPAISSMTREAKRAELESLGIKTYKDKPLADLNGAEASNALGMARRGELASGKEGAVDIIDRALAKKRTGKGKIYSATEGLFDAAHDAAIDVFVAAIKAGRLLRDAVREAMNKFREMYPEHSEEEYKATRAALDESASASGVEAPRPDSTTKGPVNPHSAEYRKDSDGALGRYEYAVTSNAAQAQYAKDMADFHEEQGTFETALAEMRKTEVLHFRGMIAAELLARQLEAEVNATGMVEKAIIGQRINVLWYEVQSYKTAGGKMLQANVVMNGRVGPYLAVLKLKGFLRDKLEAEIGSKFPADVDAKLQKGIREAGEEAGEILDDALEAENEAAEKAPDAEVSRIINTYAKYQSDTPSWSKASESKIQALLKAYINGKIDAAAFTSGLSALGVREAMSGTLLSVADRQRATVAYHRWFKKNEAAEKFLKEFDPTLRLLRKAATARGIKFTDLFKDLPANQEARRKEFFDRVSAEPKLQDLSESQREKLARNLDEAWTFVRNQVFAREFNRLVELPNVAKIDAERVKSVVDEIIKYSNLGLLDNTAFLNALAEKYGMEGLDGPTATRLMKLAAKIQVEANPAAKAKLELEMLNELHVASGVPIPDLIVSFMYAHILSGYTTLAGGMIVPNIMGSFAQLGTVALLNPTRVGTLAKGWAYGFREGIRQARSIIATTHGGQDAAAIMAETRGDALELLAKEELYPKFKRMFPYLYKAVSGYSDAAKYVGRFVRAIDAVAYYPAREAWTRVVTEKMIEAQYGTEKLNAMTEEMLLLRPGDFEAVQKQAEEEGFTGHDLARRVSALIEGKRAATEMGEKAVEEGKRFAKTVTLTQEPEGLAGVIYHWVAPFVQKFRPGGVPVLKPFLLFMRVPTNFANQTFAFTPIGGASAMIGRRAIGLGKNGLKYRQLSNDEKQALYLQSAIGSAVLGYFAYRALMADPEDPDDLVITAAGPRNVTERQQWLAAGNTPYSLKWKGVSINYQSSPLGAPLSLAGHVADWARYERGKTDEGALNAMVDSMARFPSVIFGLPMLQGLAELAEMTDPVRPDVDGTIRFFKNMGKSIVMPRIIEQIAKSFTDIPNTKEGAVVYDSLGDPVIWKPWRRHVSFESSDQLRRYLDGHSITVPAPGRGTWLHAPVKDLGLKGERMSEEIYQEYVRESGIRKRRLLEEVLLDPRGVKTDADATQAWVRKVSQSIHEEVLGKIREDHPREKPDVSQ